LASAVITLALQSQVAPQIAAAAASYKALAVAEQQAEQGAARYASTLQRLALADAKTATESQRLAVQTANAARAQTQAEGAALRLANAQDKAARGSGLAAQFAEGLKSGLLGIVGPAALATGAIGAVVGVANSFKEAFTFKTQLDATTSAIRSQLTGVRDANAVFASGQAFADKYKITQEEITSTLQASIGVLRTSRSSTTDLLTTLSLLQATTPDKPISEAARAVRELATGDVTSIKELFNVSAGSAAKMKAEIAAGGDAVQVVARYLKDSGASMELLENRTKGATGAFNDLAVAQSKLKIAQAEFAEGPGLVLLAQATKLVSDATKLLQGDVRGLNDALKDTGAGAINPLLGALLSYNSAVLDAGNGALNWLGITKAEPPAIVATSDAIAASIPVIRLRATATDEDRVAMGKAQIASAQFSQVIQQEGAAKVEAQIHTADLARQQAQLEIDSINAAKGIFASGDQAVALAAKYGIAVNAARFLISEQNKLALGAGPTEGRSERQGAGGNNETRIALEQQRQEIADAKSLRTLQTGSTAQQIAERKRLYDIAVTQYGKGSAQAIGAETDLIQARNSATKAHSGELNKQLKLNEGIYDSVAKQRDAMLDMEELAIRDRQQDRADQAKIRSAQAILADPRKARFHDAARDALALIDVQDRKRANELAEKSSTAGAQIIGGKLYQSAPGGALPVSAPIGAGGALPSPTGAPVKPGAAAGQALGAGIEVMVYLDGAQIAANVVTRMRAGLAQHEAGGG
jgi:hypothetical protein